MEFNSGAVGHPNFYDQEGNYSNPGDYINWPVKGTIIGVYPTDDENAGTGQVLCDVALCDYDYTLYQLPIYTSAFHQDTDPQTNKLARQTASPRSRNIYDGESWIPSIGTICLVQFIGPPGPQRPAAITHFCPTANQSLPYDGRDPADKIYPKEAQAVTILGGDGQPTEEFRSRLHPTESETPRWTRMQNGTAVEIDNRGNLNIQATINKDPLQKERFSDFDYTKPEYSKAPDPEGNVVVSTRGAKRGNIAHVSGRLKVKPNKKVGDEIDETSDEGNQLRLTGFAKQGNITDDLRDAVEGLFSVLTGKGDGKDAQQAKGTISFTAFKAKDGSVVITTNECDVGNISLVTPKSKKGTITLSTSKAGGGKITIVDKAGSTVVLDGKGNINASAKKDLTATAKGSATITANKTVTVSGKGNVTINGTGMVNINAKGLLSINGSALLNIKSIGPMTLSTPTILSLVATQIKFKKFVPITDTGGGLASSLTSLGISPEIVTQLTTTMESLGLAGVATDIISSIEGSLTNLASFGLTSLTDFTSISGMLTNLTSLGFVSQLTSVTDMLSNLASLQIPSLGDLAGVVQDIAVQGLGDLIGPLTESLNGFSLSGIIGDATDLVGKIDDLIQAGIEGSIQPLEDLLKEYTDSGVLGDLTPITDTLKKMAQKQMTSSFTKLLGSLKGMALK